MASNLFGNSSVNILRYGNSSVNILRNENALNHFVKDLYDFKKKEFMNECSFK